MIESRTVYVKKNILYSYLSTILLSLLAMVCRTIFVYCLGAEYLGVAGLFTNVLGVLSFSELGIGTAINFALYKPVAANDTEKISSLLILYKKAYRGVALIVTVLGILLLPFLQYIVHTGIPMQEIRIFYLVFLFNTVTSYFVTYKTSYVSALQKNYILTSIQTIFSIIVNVVQISVLLAGGDYLFYLLVAAAVGVMQKIVTVLWLNAYFPVLQVKTAQPIEEDVKNSILRNVKAMIVHKFGDVAVNQTDNIIISVCTSTAMVGLVSNYVTINSMVAMFTTALFGSTMASIGNLIAKESKEKVRKIFDEYDFLGFWIYGFVMIAFITLSQPFITLWLGKDMLVDRWTMILFFVSKYLEGLCVVTYNFKAADGRFNEDKWVPYLQAAVNLGVSVAALKLIGLPGIYVGTICQRLIVNYVRPHIVYKYVLEADVRQYFGRMIFRLMLLSLICLCLGGVSRYVLSEITIGRFAFMVLITAIVPNLTILILYWRTEMMQGLIKRVFGKENGKNAAK